MKIKHILFIIFFLVASDVWGIQAKKPSLMILPSDNWCVQRFFVTEYDNQGIKQKVPNYKQAFQEDLELGQVISKIGALMKERGFPVKDAERELKAIETRKAENNMTYSYSTGSGLSESPLDILKNKAKSDIIIEIWWSVKKTVDGKVVSFVLEAFDSYTSKQIASSSGNSKPNDEDIVPIMLENAVIKNIDPFVEQLEAHFINMKKKGREVRITVRRWNDWEMTLESQVNGKEIRDHIYDWMYENTVEGSFNESDATRNIIRYEQVRIPLFDNRGRAIDARQFAKGLRKFLESKPFNLDVKLMSRGLGEAILILGGK